MSEVQQEVKAWLDKVIANKEILTTFVGNYHPAHLHHRDVPDMEITAPGAEMACEVVRKEIGRVQRDVVVEFHTAIDKEDVKGVYSLLQGAWFGVPESTSCWNVEGFTEAVDLLDDPPEVDE